DLDVLPGEGARNPDSKRLPDRFLAREAARVGLGRVGARVAVRALGRREAALAEAWIPLERATNSSDFDQVHSDPHGGAARMKIVRLLIVREPNAFDDCAVPASAASRRTSCSTKPANARRPTTTVGPHARR